MLRFDQKVEGVGINRQDGLCSLTKTANVSLSFALEPVRVTRVQMSPETAKALSFKRRKCILFFKAASCSSLMKCHVHGNVLVFMNQGIAPNIDLLL